MCGVDYSARSGTSSAPWKRKPSPESSLFTTSGWRQPNADIDPLYLATENAIAVPVDASVFDQGVIARPFSSAISASRHACLNRTPSSSARAGFTC